MKVAVVGHTEWIDFIRVPRMPGPGEIVHAEDAWDSPGGGGAVAAVQLAKLAGACAFFTAVGRNDLGRRTQRELSVLGVDVQAGVRKEPQRRAITYIVDSGERSITVLGVRSSPSAADPLPWSSLAECDAVFLTAGDPAAVRLARQARVLVATSRVLPLLRKARVELDAVVGSSLDPSELYADGDLDPPPRLAVRTAGPAGGTFQVPGGPQVPYLPTPLPGPVVDTYGCGDSFAAGLTFGLGLGLASEAAVELAARCGSAVATGKGPYSTQLTGAQLVEAGIIPPS
ncbi:MAG TPA: PfkB family carbohydrate kinase [Actinomycetota bacterium]|nr:PfkB family carbohydrate kinase [Actinomycetota bacterium]